MGGGIDCLNNKDVIISYKSVLDTIKYNIAKHNYFSLALLIPLWDLLWHALQLIDISSKKSIRWNLLSFLRVKFMLFYKCCFICFIFKSVFNFFMAFARLFLWLLHFCCERLWRRSLSPLSSTSLIQMSRDYICYDWILFLIICF